MDILLAIGLAFLFGLGLWLGFRLGRRIGRVEAERDLPQRIGTARQDAVKRSRAVLGGQVGERFAPHFPDFPYDPTEVRFLGTPVDYVAFKGASGDGIEEVAFIEVKTGDATLSRVERSLRDTIRAGRVRWIEYRVPDSTNL